MNGYWKHYEEGEFTEEYYYNNEIVEKEPQTDGVKTEKAHWGYLIGYLSLNFLFQYIS